MYMSGLGDAWEDAAIAEQAAYGGGSMSAPVITATPAPATGDPFGGWGSVVSQGLTIWGNVQSSNNALEIQKAYAARGIAPPGYTSPYTSRSAPVAYATRPLNSPFPGQAQSTLLGMDTTTLLILAAVAIGAYLYTQR